MTARSPEESSGPDREHGMNDRRDKAPGSWRRWVVLVGAVLALGGCDGRDTLVNVDPEPELDNPPGVVETPREEAN